MATTQEVDILLKTVGDTSGAVAVSSALQQTQQAAQQTQQTLSAQQQFANQVLRQSMAQVPQTVEAFRGQMEALEKQIGARPTLRPQDFGINAEAVSTASKTAAQSIRTVGESASVTDGEVLRMGAAFVGTAIGLSAFTASGKLAHDVIDSMVTSTTALDAATRANAITLGEQASGFQTFAQLVSQQAGVTQQSLLEAGTAAQQFARAVGLGPEAVQGLTAVATALAQVRGTDVGQTMQLLSAAMQGNAQAAQALNLQLDDSFVAYTQLGGATADVFNMLDPATQATLRYSAALEQLPRQLQQVSGPVQQLRDAQKELNTVWEGFATTTGPSLVTALAAIETGAAKALDAYNKLIAVSQQGGIQQHPENTIQSELGALFQNVQQQLQTAQTQPFSPEQVALLESAKQHILDLNAALKDRTGIDVLQAGQQAVTAAADATGQALDSVKQKAGEVADAVTAPIRAVADSFNQAGQSIAQVADQADRARQAQLQAAGRRIDESGAAGTLAAAQQNEIVAAEQLDQLRRDGLNLTAQEAQIRLSMLPAQERMLELQNQVNQAQIEATQRALPAQRGLEDLQNQIEQNRLIAENGNRSLEERRAALAAGAAEVRQLPGAEQAALQARVAGLPAARAAQDVGLAAQLQGLQQQQAVQGLEYQRQQTGFLQQIAEAVSVAARRDINLSIAAINAILQPLGGVSEEDIQKLAAMSGEAAAQAIVATFHSAVQSVSTGQASPQLLGAGT